MRAIRRWLWRSVLILGVVALAGSTATGVRAFNRACDGSLEGLRYLANVRAQLAEATALPPTPTPPPPTPTAIRPTPTPDRPAAGLLPTQTPPPPAPQPPPPAPPAPSLGQRLLAVLGMAGDAAIVAFARVKQNDAVAYPAHIVAAHTLSAAGCTRDAVRLQWLKAGLHASRDGQPERIADALVASTSGTDDLAELQRIVRTWTERASENVPLRRVLAALERRER